MQIYGSKVDIVGEKSIILLFNFCSQKAQNSKILGVNSNGVIGVENSNFTTKIVKVGNTAHPTFAAQFPWAFD